MRSLAASLCLAFAAGSALAGGVPHAGDVGVLFRDGKVVTTIVPEEELRGSLGQPQRVFESTLGTIEFGDFGNDEPGYTTDALPVDATIGFNIRAELKRWNGSDFDGGIPETLQIAKFLGTPAELARATGPAFVPGFSFATADGAGFFDEHLSHVLRGPAVPAGFDDPRDGIYLLELELFTNAPGIANSESFWIVFNLNSPQQELDDALEHVETTLVPTPGAGGLLLAACAIGAGRRRRR